MPTARLFIHLTFTFSTYLHSCRVQMNAGRNFMHVTFWWARLTETRRPVIKILSRFKAAQKPRRLGSCFSSLHLVHLSLGHTHFWPCDGNSSPKSGILLLCAAVKIKRCRTNACSHFHQGQNGHAQQMWLFAGWINAAFARTQQTFSYHV